MSQDTLARTVEWFEKAVPKPTSKNFHTQLGVHFEEVNEMLMEVSTDDFETQSYLDVAKMALHQLATHLKRSDGVVYIEDEDQTDFLDALCDQVVTAAGCAVIIKADIVGGLKEVNRSNFSKFDADGQPIFDENRKVTKGPAYSKPDLRPFAFTI